MLCKVYLFLAVVSVAEMKKIGCEDFELSEWDCETLLYKISEDNIGHTLYCLGYDKGARPLSPNKTRLHVARTLDQLIEVDEDNGMIELEEDYRLLMFDPRLTFNLCQLGDGEPEAIFFGQKLLKSMFWIPKFVPSRKSLYKPRFDLFHLFLKRNETDPNGRNIRISNQDTKVKIRCEMQYQWFPFDTQKCSHPYILQAETKDIELLHTPSAIINRSSIQTSFNPDWYISLEVGDGIEVTTIQVPDEAGKTTLQFLPLDLIFQRKISVHILHLYVPSLMLCIASMASLFIPPDLVPGRMGLSVTSCLSMITLFVAAKYLMLHSV